MKDEKSDCENSWTKIHPEECNQFQNSLSCSFEETIQPLKKIERKKKTDGGEKEKWIHCQAGS